MVTSNLRQSFRIPIAPEVKMTARLHTENEESYRVIPRDLAQAGMEVEFPGETNPFLPVGSRVSIELQYRDETVLRTAEIRRALDSRYGVMSTD